MGDGLLAIGLMAIEVIAQKGHAPRRIVRAPGIQPAFPGSPFAVWLFLAVLGADKLRWQGDDMRLAWRDYYRRDGAVPVPGMVILERLAATAGAGDFFRGKEIRAVQSHQQGSADTTKRFEIARG